MTLEQWAIHFNIQPEAVQALRIIWGAYHPQPTGKGEGSEAGAQADIRLEASKKGLRLWRNNVGAAVMEDGSFVRYGLANESKKMNEKIKSSDLIGIRPVVITEAMVGEVLGQFVAREVKHPGWTYKGRGREVAQLKFIQLVHSLGGDAKFADGAGDSMIYMGSKRRLAKTYAPILNEAAKGRPAYVEPFMGGLNMMEEIKHPRRIGADLNEYVVAMFQHAVTGGLFPESITQEQWKFSQG